MTKRDYFTNARCPKCREQMILSPVADYSLYCEVCEEDFYTIEVHEIMGDFFEVSVCMSSKEFYGMLEAIKANFKDACFIGYDDLMEVCDIGFENIPNGKRVRDIINFFHLIER